MLRNALATLFLVQCSKDHSRQETWSQFICSALACSAGHVRVYYGSQDDCNDLEINFLNYTGHQLHRAFWQELFCVIRAPPNCTFCAHANYTD